MGRRTDRLTSWRPNNKVRVLLFDVVIYTLFYFFKVIVFTEGFEKHEFIASFLKFLSPKYEFDLEKLFEKVYGHCIYECKRKCAEKYICLFSWM
jgi:hypothetical protein